MKCNFCNEEFFLFEHSVDGLCYCTPCYEKLKVCEYCGKMVKRRQMISDKFACDDCFTPKNKSITDPRIKKLLSEPPPPKTTTSSKFGDFESLSSEALTSALKFKNYEIIGVSPHASLNEVREKCKELLKLWHPDLYKNDQEKQSVAVQKTAELKQAYEAINEDLEHPYKTLELSYGASEKDVFKAFENLKLIYNPTYFTDNPALCEKVKYKRDEITKAFDNLIMQFQINPRTQNIAMRQQEQKTQTSPQPQSQTPFTVIESQTKPSLTTTNQTSARVATPPEPQISMSKGSVASSDNVKIAQSSHELGCKWLYFWNYFSLPFGLLTEVVVMFAGGLLLIICLISAILHAFVIYGLHKRKLWAWKWNWLVVAMSYIVLIIPTQVPGSNLDSGALMAQCVAKSILGALLWVWPNYVYWTKRKCLFDGYDTCIEKKSSNLGIIVVGAGILIILVGIIAAIAIPQFANRRNTNSSVTYSPSSTSTAQTPTQAITSTELLTPTADSDYNKAAISDLKNLATALEAHFADNQSYPNTKTEFSSNYRLSQEVQILSYAPRYDNSSNKCIGYFISVFHKNGDSVFSRLNYDSDPRYYRKLKNESDEAYKPFYDPRNY